MNALSNSESTQPTDDEIDAALLAALDQASSGGDDLHPWAEIRRRLPGTDDRKNERLTALFLAGRVWLIKVAGRNYVALGDADDERQAAADRTRGHARSPLVL